MNQTSFKGLIAAVCTPFRDDCQVHLPQIDVMVDALLRQPIGGLFVCGSTGEGPSLTNGERRQVAEAYVRASAGRLPVMIQVGHNSLEEACELAAHAQQIGAQAVSATCPSYYKLTRVSTLVDCMTKVATAAPDLPFYYYHIPELTGVSLDMVSFLQQAASQIPNLAGMKYTHRNLHEFQCCLELDQRRFSMLWGCDEMLLSAWSVGAQGAVGSTYNIAANLYAQIIDAFGQQDLKTARQKQLQAGQLIRCLDRWPFHSALKEVMRQLGIDCGPCRLPHRPLSPTEADQLKRDLSPFNLLPLSPSANPKTHASVSINAYY